MKVTNRELAESVLTDLRSGKSSQQVARSLAAYFISERRTKDADAVVREIDRLLRQQGVVELEVTSVAGVSSDIKAELSRLFTTDDKQTISVHETHDPTVLGGVLVESGDQRLDLTVRRQIQRLKGVRV